MVRISDGRMSGTSYGACILHVAPESFVGGPLAFVQTGDEIEIDVDARRIHLHVSDDELAAAAPPGSRRRRATRAATARCSPSTSARPTRAATSISSHGTAADRGAGDSLNGGGRRYPEYGFEGSHMRLVTFVEAGAERLGFLVGDTVVDPLRAFGERSGDARALFADAAAFIRSGDKGIAAARAMLADPPRQALLPRSGVTLTAPLRPSTILCSGSNYHDHNAEKANTPISGKEPEFFVKTADCVVGPDEPIAFDDPALTRKLDCEIELAIVIGKPGRHIPVERALDHVFGYTIVNDVTARDRQVRTPAEGTTWYDLGRGKAFDGGAPLGPCIVTADEIADPQTLTLMSRVNGELRQSSSTVEHDLELRRADPFLLDQLHPAPRHGDHHRHAGRHRLVEPTRSSAARASTQPGLVAATRYCLPGDVVECEIESIGTLRNPVVRAEAEAESAPPNKLHRTAIV